MKADREKFTEPSFSPEIQGKLRLYRRVLISYIDIQQARAISSYILKEDLHANFPQKNRILLKALNCAMVISYARPFSGNDQGTDPKIPDLPGRFIRIFSQEEKEVHEIVLRDRNTVLAHSDSQAWEMEPKIFRRGGNDLLAPLHNDVHAPLKKEIVVLFSKMCEKLMAALFSERDNLELVLKPYLRVIDMDTLSTEQIEKEL